MYALPWRPPPSARGRRLRVPPNACGRAAATRQPGVARTKAKLRPMKRVMRTRRERMRKKKPLALHGWLKPGLLRHLPSLKLRRTKASEGILLGFVLQGFVLRSFSEGGWCGQEDSN